MNEPLELKKSRDYEEQFIHSCRHIGFCAQSKVNPQDPPAGFGTAKLSQNAIRTFKQLNTRICSNLEKMIYWSSYSDDRRERGYCILSNSKQWNSIEKLTAEELLFTDEGLPEEEARLIHQQVLDKSFVALELFEEERESVEELINHTREILNTYRNQLKPYELGAVTIENLVAIQPNLHNGERYLPLHLDCPRNDGFGIVIVTVSVEGSADVVIVDEGDPVHRAANQATNLPQATEWEQQHNSIVGRPRKRLKQGSYPSQFDFTGNQETHLNEALSYCSRKKRRGNNCSSGTNAADAEGTDVKGSVGTSNDVCSSRRCWTYPVHEGEMYVLSGHSRNKCAHGVVAFKGSRGKGRIGARQCAFQRQSLNFRFGIHTKEQAWEDIDQHWS